MKRFERTLQVFLLLIFIYYSQFYKLGVITFRIWDESRLATSAYEMTKTGNWIVTTVGNEPDMWSTKPPLMIWAQAICIKLHGLSEFSTRFPSAACAAITIIIVFIFLIHVTKNGWAALLGATVLCTAKGYIGYHGTRYGEYDSMLTLFTTSYLLAFFVYIENTDSSRKNKFLLLFFFAVILAALTKGIAGLLFAPILFLYALWRKQLTTTLTNKYLYIGIIAFLIIVFGYYFLREHFNPGYLKAVFENELGGRFFSENEGHVGPPDYYYQNLKWERLSSWFWILPVALFLTFAQPNHKQLRTTSYAFICATLFLVLLSLSKTKLAWYDLPAYPIFAIIIGIATIQLSSFIEFLLPFINRRITLLTVCILISAQPVYEAFQMITYSHEDLNKDSFYDISYYLRDAFHSSKDLNNVIYFSANYNWQWKLYADKIKEGGTKLRQEKLNGQNEFNIGQKILAHQKETKNYIEEHYSYSILENFYGVKMYKITSPKTL